MIVLRVITSAILDYVVIVLFVLMLNYIINKDFRNLINQIKKIAFSRQTNKAISIKNIIYSYFFIED